MGSVLQLAGSAETSRRCSREEKILLKCAAADGCNASGRQSTLHPAAEHTLSLYPAALTPCVEDTAIPNNAQQVQGHTQAARTWTVLRPGPFLAAGTELKLTPTCAAALLAAPQHKQVSPDNWEEAYQEQDCPRDLLLRQPRQLLLLLQQDPAQLPMLFAAGLHSPVVVGSC